MKPNMVFRPQTPRLQNEWSFKFPSFPSSQRRCPFPALHKWTLWPRPHPACHAAPAGQRPDRRRRGQHDRAPPAVGSGPPRLWHDGRRGAGNARPQRDRGEWTRHGHGGPPRPCPLGHHHPRHPRRAHGGEPDDGRPDGGRDSCAALYLWPPQQPTCAAPWVNLSISTTINQLMNQLITNPAIIYLFVDVCISILITHSAHILTVTFICPPTFIV